MKNESEKFSAVRGGIQLGWQLTALYAFLFLVFAGLRITLTLLEAPPETGLVSLILANMLCLAWVVTVFTLAGGLAAVVLGMATGFILEKLVKKLSPSEPAYQGAFAGCLTALLFLMVLQLVPYMVWHPYFQTVPSATLWLWFWNPDILYLLSSSMAGWVIQRSRRTG